MSEQFKKDKEGRYICPNCGRAMDKVLQTQYDNIRWEWVPQEKIYVKIVDGDSEQPMCGECGTHIDWDYGEKLGY